MQCLKKVLHHSSRLIQILIIKISRKIKSVWIYIHIFFHGLRLLETKQNTTQVVSVYVWVRICITFLQLRCIQNLKLLKWKDFINVSNVMCVCVYVHVVCVVNIFVYFISPPTFGSFNIKCEEFCGKWKVFTLNATLFEYAWSIRAWKLAQKLCKIFSWILQNFR